ncbi:MAG: MBG-2 domain-containing protein, partial [Deltaproteobacteria bacterium]|nr:MBG-2 domain-containing protein [Deltaproteobacteria bacterium]
YSTGSVTATGAYVDYVGGLAGYNSGAITNSYWDTETSGKATSAGGTGLTTVEMMTMASFTNWDIANSGGAGTVWRIYEGQTYPLLTSFLTPLTVTADNVSKTYDGTTDGIGAIYSPLTPDMSNILGTLSYTGAVKDVGSYTITPGGLYSNQQGYDISYVDGALTVNPAPLTITADNKSKVYGDANPALTAAYSGLKGTDTSAVVSGLTLNTAATTGSNVGSYTITAADGTAANYTITFANGALTITAAPSTASTSTQTTTSSVSTILDMYQIMDTENITDIKNFNDTVVSAGTPHAELFTAKAVNYEIEQTVFGYQPPKEDTFSVEDEGKKDKTKSK